MIVYRTHAAVEAKGKADPWRCGRRSRRAARVGGLVERAVVAARRARPRARLLLGAFARVARRPLAAARHARRRAGIGKSRLVAELGDAVEEDEEIITWRYGRCLPYGDGVSFWALGEIVKAQAGIHENDDARATAAKLARRGRGARNRRRSAAGS